MLRIKERLGRSSSSANRSLKVGKDLRFLKISALVRAARLIGLRPQRVEGSKQERSSKEKNIPYLLSGSLKISSGLKRIF